MKTNRAELDKYSTGELFRAGIQKLFAKKAVRLTFFCVAAVVAVVLMRTVYRYSYRTAWWLYDLLCFPAFTVWAAASAGFIANIGCFSMKKFMRVAVGSGVLSWLLKTSDDLSGCLWPPDPWADFRDRIGMELLRTLPMMLVSVGVILLIAKIISCKRGDGVQAAK